MPKTDAAYVGHMLDTARKARSKVEGKTRADFDGDENLRLALTHLLQVIGEAAGKVSDAFRAQHTHIPWRAIVGMRNKVVHDYLDVDEDAVWDTATQDLDTLIAALAAIVPPESGTTGEPCAEEEKKEKEEKSEQSPDDEAK